MRAEFAKALRAAIIDELRQDYPQPGADVNSYSEASRAIEGFRITIKSIRGGSLEVLIFVLGFAKLVQALGITPDEFSKYIDIAAPAAMSAIFGVREGAVEPDTTPAGDSGAASAAEGGGTAPAPRPRPEPSMASLYFMPAVFAAVAFGAAMYAFLQISTHLVDERAAYGGYVHDEMQNISKERSEIANKLATLIKQHDAAVAEAQKTLFDDQLALLKNASASAAARDNALVDLVKAQLIPAREPKPMPPEMKPPPAPCVLDAGLIKNVQAALKEHFLYGGKIDGLYGGGTENGVSRFQSRMNLPVTGKVDPITGSLLGISCKSP